MSLALSKQERRAIPKWRDSYTSAALGESASSVIKNTADIDINYFNEIQKHWEKNKSITTAAELIGAAHVYAKTDQAIDAAKYIIDNNKKTTPTILNLAKSLYTKIDISNQLVDTNYYLNSTKVSLYKRIHELKVDIHNDPRNSIAYVDIARLYSIIGEEELSIKMMVMALSTASNNRFILRSASRLFVHIEEPEMALSLLRNTPNMKFDPMLLSAEISISAMNGSVSKHINTAKKLVTDKKYFNLHLSELSSALATLYLMEGNTKKAKKYYASSLICPNDNSFAQAIWASEKQPSIVIPNNIIVNPPPFSYEANALRDRNLGNWNNIIDHCVNWLNDEPYSTRPALLGSFVAAIAKQDHKLCESIVRKSLEANPNDIHLLNNLVVALANQGNLIDAEINLTKIYSLNIEDEDDTTLNATKGLLMFRKGHIEAGRNLYQDAIVKASKNNWIDHAVLLLLHLTREEIIAKTNDADELIKMAEEKSKLSNQPETKIMLENVLSLYKNINKNNRDSIV